MATMKMKNYFKKEFQVPMLKLEHDDLSDFYLSPCQKNRSAVPLLCLRTILFLGCLGILISSPILTLPLMSFRYWLIFLTHWGLILITVATASAVLVSLKAYVGDPNDTPRGMQLFVKIYWVLYNTAVPIAFLITIFYWSFLVDGEEEHEIDPVLDVFIHGVNSVVMLVLVLFSRQPSRLLHVLHPIVFGLVYLLFSIIYYFAGGLGVFGAPYIYPILDWSAPGETILTVLGTVFFLIAAHILVVLISLGRDKLSKRYFRETHSMNLYNDAYN